MQIKIIQKKKLKPASNAQVYICATTNTKYGYSIKIITHRV